MICGGLHLATSAFARAYFPILTTSDRLPPPINNNLVIVAEGIVTGRGCSTKDKVFYKECETHSYGDTVEKMCFCSFFLCNGSAISSCSPNALLTLVLALGVVLLTSDSAADSTAKVTEGDSSGKRGKVEAPGSDGAESFPAGRCLNPEQKQEEEEGASFSSSSQSCDVTESG